MNREDFASLAMLCCFVLGCVLTGLAVAITGHSLTEAMWSMGATEEPASWIGYGVAFIVWCVIGFSTGGRLVNGVWWFGS